MSKKKKIIYKERIVQHDDGEGNWLVSYADMMTLLFGFFVILSAFSTPNAQKLEKMKEETAKAMGVKYENPNEELAQVLENILKAAKLEDQVQVVRTDGGITIVMRGTLFFDSGSAELKPQARELVEQICKVLVQGASKMKLIVEGHTDDVPIVSAAFPSNWELSGNRASTVVRILEGYGYPHENLLPMGLADTDPLVPNLDANRQPIPENRMKNRRIVLRIVKQLPSRTGHLKSLE